MKSLGLAVGSGAIGEPFKKVAAVWVESTMRETTREARQCMEKVWEAWVGDGGKRVRVYGENGKGGGWVAAGWWVVAAGRVSNGRGEQRAGAACRCSPVCKLLDDPHASHARSRRGAVGAVVSSRSVRLGVRPPEECIEGPDHVRMVEFGHEVRLLRGLE